MRPRYLIALLCLALALAAPAVSSAATLTFSTPSCSDFTVTSNGGNVTLNCVPIGGGGTTGVPSGCSLTASPSSLPVGGGSVVLNASCTGGAAPTSYAWTGGSILASTSTGTQTDSVKATTTYSVTPANGSGPGNTASATVTVGGGGGGGTGLCANYTSVINMDVPWGGTNDTRSNATPFVANGILVVRFTVPAGASFSPGSPGAVSVSEFGDPPVYRQASLSKEACDFRGVATGAYDQYLKDVTGQLPYPLQWGLGNTATTEFTVTGNALFRPQLQPGQTYYFNVRNWSPYANSSRGGPSCSGGTCNVIVHISTP